MDRTRVKICGVRDAQTASAAVRAGADAIGLVFVDGSARRVTLAEAAAVLETLAAFVEPVALFADQSAREIRRTAAELGIATVQLHGREDPAVAAELAPLRVIKAIGFDPRSFQASVTAWRHAPGRVVGLLVDAPAPSDDAASAARGGSGRTVDWQALADAWPPSGPDGRRDRLVLAGGLDPANVGQAIRTLRPGAVDVSSGVESRRGAKDPRLIEAFCEAVRLADRRDA